MDNQSKYDMDNVLLISFSVLISSDAPRQKIANFFKMAGT